MPEELYHIWISNRDTDQTCSYGVFGWENALAAYEAAVWFADNVDAQVAVDLVEYKTSEIKKTTFEDYT